MENQNVDKKTDRQNAAAHQGGKRDAVENSLKEKPCIAYRGTETPGR